MRKKLGYFFVALCTTLLVFYLFRYKQVVVLEGKVPNTATEIVHIDLRQIEHHVVIDAIKNPLRYISLKSKKKGAVSLKKTITIPQNLLLFTNATNFKDAWFSSFITLKDEVKLKSYLLQKGFKESLDNELHLFRKGRAVVAISDKQLVVAYKKQQDQSIVSAIRTIYNGVKFYKEDADLLQSISNSESDISYANGASDFLEADFKNGLFEIKGAIQSDLFEVNNHSEQAENSIGFFAAKINKDHPIFKSLISDKNKLKFDDFTKLSIDSILRKWDGRVTLDLKTIDKKIDTIVTYEYDDDFNKIEKKSVQELIVPDMTATLGSKAGLYTYFYENNAVQIVENDTLFTSIPLYRMYAERKHDGFRIFSKKNNETIPSKSKQYKVNAYLDIQKYLKKPLDFSILPTKNENLENIENASAKLTTHNELTIQVRIKDSNRNFLCQFIKP